MKRIITTVVSLSMLLLLGACTSSKTSAPYSSQMLIENETTTRMTTLATTTTSTDTSDTDIAVRMIVRNGDMTVMVDNIKTAIDRISALAALKNGWVVSSQVSPVGEGLTGSITIRVPAEEFDNAMRDIGALSVEVKAQSTSSRDVTQEYTDLNSKLTNLLATEQQYLEILKKATTVTDIMTVQSALARTQQDIEITKGQILYLERTSSTSLITVYLQQSALVAKINLSRTVVNADEVVSCSVEITGGFAPYSYAWDFGDKVTSTKIAPEHSYKSPGTYKVTVKLTDDHSSSITEFRYVTVAGGWDGGSVARAAWRALITLSRVLLNILIWIGIFSFVWIPVGALVFFLVRRKKKGSKTP